MLSHRTSRRVIFDFEMLFKFTFHVQIIYLLRLFELAYYSLRDNLPACAKLPQFTYHTVLTDKLFRCPELSSYALCRTFFWFDVLWVGIVVNCELITMYTKMMGDIRCAELSFDFYVEDSCMLLVWSKDLIVPQFYSAQCLIFYASP